MNLNQCNGVELKGSAAGGVCCLIFEVKAGCMYHRVAR